MDSTYNDKLIERIRPCHGRVVKARGLEVEIKNKYISIY